MEENKLEKYQKELSDVQEELDKADTNMSINQANTMMGLIDKKNWLEKKIEEIENEASALDTNND